MQDVTSVLCRRPKWTLGWCKNTEILERVDEEREETGGRVTSFQVTSVSKYQVTPTDTVSRGGGW